MTTNEAEGVPVEATPHDEITQAIQNMIDMRDASVDDEGVEETDTASTIADVEIVWKGKRYLIDFTIHEADSGRAAQ